MQDSSKYLVYTMCIPAIPTATKKITLFTLSDIFYAFCLVTFIIYMREYRCLSKDSQAWMYSKSKKELSIVTKISPDQGLRQRTRTLIYTMFRSGSSFTGEIFSHHPDVFYMFEPMQLYAHGSKDRDYYISKHGIPLLQHALRCNVAPLLHDVESYSKQGTPIIAGELGMTTFCRDNSMNISYGKTCDPCNATSTQQRCQRHNHVVAKTIVLRNIPALQTLLEDGVKVIHLVRDPRGQILSIHHLTNESISSIVKWVCPAIRKDLYDAFKMYSLSKEFRESVWLVRYEDLAYHTTSWSRKLLAFSGVGLHGDISGWLKLATTTSDTRPMSTTRISTQTPEAWRKTILFDDLKFIQAKCGDTLDMLGYRRLPSFLALRALNLTVVKNISSNMKLYKIYNHYRFV